MLSFYKGCEACQPLAERIRERRIVHGRILFQPEVVDLQGHARAVEFGIETGDQVIAVQDG